MGLGLGRVEWLLLVQSGLGGGESKIEREDEQRERGRESIGGGRRGGGMGRGRQ